MKGPGWSGGGVVAACGNRLCGVIDGSEKKMNFTVDRFVSCRFPCRSVVSSGFSAGRQVLLTYSAALDSFAFFFVGSIWIFLASDTWYLVLGAARVLTVLLCFSFSKFKFCSLKMHFQTHQMWCSKSSFPGLF